MLGWSDFEVKSEKKKLKKLNFFEIFGLKFAPEYIVKFSELFFLDFTLKTSIHKHNTHPSSSTFLGNKLFLFFIFTRKNNSSTKTWPFSKISQKYLKTFGISAYIVY